MLKIEFKESVIRSERVMPSMQPGRKQFEPFDAFFQVGYVYLVDQTGQQEPVPTKMKVPSVKDGKAYPVGMFEVGPGSLYVDGRSSKLVVGRLQLRQLVASTAKAA